MNAGLWALLAATIAAIELLRAIHLLPAFHRLAAHGRRSARLLVRRGVSEWAKERAIGLSSRRMFALTFAATIRLALAAAPFGAVLWLDHLHPFGLARAWTDWPARIWLLVVTTVYIAVRRMAGRSDRLLQSVALGTRPLVELSFDLERGAYGSQSSHLPLVKPVFIVGLARSGTSVLTRELHRTGSFASLSYRDLPFPLAPNLWQRVSGGCSRAIAATERGHGDGLLHDLDSPEAIEEVFWLSREGERFRKADRILPVVPEPATCAAFRDYVRLVLLRYGAGRYLSKNNANILRLPALVAIFPDAVLIHPFRDPLQHAASLRAQHVRARALAKEDPFRARFMGWLGHHEFGADYRPIRFPGAAPTTGDPAGLDYWLRTWIAAYRFLLAQPAAVAARQTFVDYDTLCLTPAEAATALDAPLGLDVPLRLAGIRAPRPHHDTRHDPALAETAYSLHAAMVARCGSGQPPITASA